MSWLYSIAIVGTLIAGTLDSPGIIRDAAETISAAPSSSAVIQKETERFEQTYPFNSNGVVSVEDVSGSIVVEAWDRDEIHLVAVKTADTREALARVSFEIEATASKFHFETEYERKSGELGGENLSVDITLKVPRTAVLDAIETVNGSVTASNFVTQTKISVVNGDVKATNLRGSAHISTVNGRLNADFDELDPNGTISLETVNGTANLSIPSDANATIRANSLNGQIANDFGLTVRKGQYVGRDLNGRVGGGGVRIKLSSVNGDLSVKRRSDGRQLSPGTDLLGSTPANRRIAAPPAPLAPEDAAELAAALSEVHRELEKAGADKERIASIHEKLLKDKRFEELKEFKNFEDFIVVFDSKEFPKQLEKVLKQKQEAFEKFRQLNINWAPMAPMIEKHEGTFPVKGKPKVIVNAGESEVSIRGWNRSEVKYVVTEFRMRHNTENSAISATENGGTVRINLDTAEGASGIFRRPAGARLEIFVPAASDLEVNTGGPIRLEGVTGSIELKGGDGPIDVRESSGSLRLDAIDGHIRVIGFNGDINAATTDGDLFLEGDIVKLSAKSTDGDVVVTLPEKFAGTISSNVVVRTEGIDLQRENERTWRRGNGASVLAVESLDGTVTIRGTNAITVN